MAELIDSLKGAVIEEYGEIFKREAPAGVIEVVVNRSISDKDIPVSEHLLGVINMALRDYYGEE